MKRLYFVGFSFLLYLHAYTQKPALDISSPELHHWPSVSNAHISSDGKYAAYTTNDIPAGSSSLVVQSTQNIWKKVFTGADQNNFFTHDSRQLIFLLPGDSLALLTLGKEKLIFIPHVASFKLIKKGKEEWLSYLSSDATKELILWNLDTQEKRSVANVTDYYFSPSGERLIVTVRENEQQSLKWINMSDGAQTKIWTGGQIFECVFDDSGHRLAFMEIEKDNYNNKNNILWYYQEGMPEAVIQVNNNTAGIDSNLVLSKSDFQFSRDGARIFCTLVEKPFVEPAPDAVKVDVWSYKDMELQSSQLQKTLRREYYLAVTDIGSNKLTRLQHANENILAVHGGNDDYSLVYTSNGDDERHWNQQVWSKLYRESTIDGSRVLIKNNFKGILWTCFQVSPEGKWVLYYDQDTRAWHSLNKDKNVFRNVTANIPYAVCIDNALEPGPMPATFTTGPVGVCGWTEDDAAILIYDNYDIWQADPAGIKKPVNLTKGYGRAHHLKFRLATYDINLTTTEGGSSGNRGIIYKPGDTLLLSAFDTENRYNGFYRVTSLDKNPEKLSMDPCVMYVSDLRVGQEMGAIEFFLIKAKDANTWIATRQSDTLARNFYITRDFKTYSALSDVNPQRQINWLTSELLQWKAPDGKLNTGILYKPENFDPKKKYPVICNYYELHEDDLYNFHIPWFTRSSLDIPFFVSRGYIVFIPSTRFKPGYPGRSILNTVVSGIRHLSKFSYIDAKHIGLQGHSFGGFETNYLVTHSNLFAAAVESAGTCDLIQAYNSLGYGGNWYLGISKQSYYETDQGRIPATLWERPDLYIENSPILRVNQVTTPLLMMHNTGDYNVAFTHAIEMFTALRRLNKRVWLLQYDKEGHGLVREKNAKDYTIRLTQFFDHYLKGAPPPKWMTEGIPARKKGIDTGLELDNNGKQP